MDIIIGGVKSGKSQEAIEWLSQGTKKTDGTYDRVVVQPNAAERDAFKLKCQTAGLTDLNKRVFSKATWDQRAKVPGLQVMYENVNEYLPADATVITIKADGKLKALTNYNVPTA